MVIAHILGDFYLQCDKWVDDKKTSGWRSKKLYCHSALVAVLTYVFSGIWIALWIIPVIFFSHALIDLLKLYLDERIEKCPLTYILDQGLHLAVLVITAYLAGIIYGPYSTFLIPEFLSNPALLLVIIAYLLIITPSGFFIRDILSPYREIVRRKEEEDKKLSGEQNSAADSNNLDNAGKLIGYLERILVLTFVLIGQYAAIGFLITAKSIFRFREDRTYLVEYYLLGTFLSIAVVLLIGLAVVFASDIFWPNGAIELYNSFKSVFSGIP
jgi:hypothetical protein